MFMFHVYYAIQGVPTFKTVDETLVYDYSNKSDVDVVQGGSDLNLLGSNPSVWPFQFKLFSSTSMWYFSVYKVVQTYKSVDESLVCDHSNSFVNSIFMQWLFVFLYWKKRKIFFVIIFQFWPES